MRADLYLHHIRIFKTRSLATQACNKGNVRIDGQQLKPARDVKVGETLEVDRAELKLILRVIDFPASRVGAPLVPKYVENLTPEENYLRAAEIRREKELVMPGILAAKPDKKQLRQIRELMERNL
ncbi:S4 domain-containing protein [Roseimicrobium sp. ORNL1]|uniref:RNA-binding S4 domain-containing protein n=1 Tax=Roseimicrobium sp. ORNL1 TaxID=2711231 RepID=UPI0013E18C6E|nr:S4 domain-containing protein [Roseimicrobium sp. ORNL1]QIF03977.1 RNA-binding S4 domain-containing protein [Roseimicrobium sp. ORNL1]